MLACIACCLRSAGVRVCACMRACACRLQCIGSRLPNNLCVLPPVSVSVSFARTSALCKMLASLSLSACGLHFRGDGLGRTASRRRLEAPPQVVRAKASLHARGTFARARCFRCRRFCALSRPTQALYARCLSAESTHCDPALPKTSAPMPCFALRKHCELHQARGGIILGCFNSLRNSFKARIPIDSSLHLRIRNISLVTLSSKRDRQRTHARFCGLQRPETLFGWPGARLWTRMFRCAQGASTCQRPC